MTAWPRPNGLQDVFETPPVVRPAAPLLRPAPLPSFAQPVLPPPLPLPPLPLPPLPGLPMAPLPLPQHMPSYDQVVSSAKAAATAAAAAAAAHAQREHLTAISTPSGWSEHTSDTGARYFYNMYNQVSTYDCPPELAQTGSMQGAAGNPWTEYKNDTGRPYWHNRLTGASTWTRPAELGDGSAAKMPAAAAPAKPRPALLAVGIPRPRPEAATPLPAPAAAPNGAHEKGDPATYKVNGEVYQWKFDEKGRPKGRDAKSSGDESDDPDRKRDKKKKGGAGRATSPPLVVQSKEEAAQMFKVLLEDHGISPAEQWKDVVADLQADKRFLVIATMGERKKLFEEFKVQKKKQAEEAQRAARLKAKADFLAMLTELGDVTPKARWVDVRRRVEDDPRYAAVESPTEREALFDDRIWELTKIEERKRKHGETAFLALLRDMDVKAGARWADEEERLAKDERFEALGPEERKLAFREYVRKLKSDEDADTQRRTAERLARERAVREPLRALLVGLAADGKLCARTAWPDAKPLLDMDAAYGAVVEQLGADEPKAMFEVLQGELGKVLEADAQLVRAAHRLSGAAFAPDTTEQQWYAKVKGAIGVDARVRVALAYIRDERPLHLQWAVQDLKESTLRRERALLAKRLQAEQRLHEAVHGAISGLPDRSLVWDTVAERLTGRSEWAALDGDDQRRRTIVAEELQLERKRRREQSQAQQSARRTSHGEDGELDDVEEGEVDEVDAAAVAPTPADVLDTGDDDLLTLEDGEEPAEPPLDVVVAAVLMVPAYGLVANAARVRRKPSRSPSPAENTRRTRARSRSPSRSPGRGRSPSRSPSRSSSRSRGQSRSRSRTPPPAPLPARRGAPRRKFARAPVSEDQVLTFVPGKDPWQPSPEQQVLKAKRADAQRGVARGKGRKLPAPASRAPAVPHPVRRPPEPRDDEPEEGEVREDQVRGDREREEGEVSGDEEEREAGDVSDDEQREEGEVSDDEDGPHAPRRKRPLHDDDDDDDDDGGEPEDGEIEPDDGEREEGEVSDEDEPRTTRPRKRRHG